MKWKCTIKETFRSLLVVETEINNTTNEDNCQTIASLSICAKSSHNRKKELEKLSSQFNGGRLIIPRDFGCIKWETKTLKLFFVHSLWIQWCALNPIKARVWGKKPWISIQLLKLNFFQTDNLHNRHCSGCLARLFPQYDTAMALCKWSVLRLHILFPDRDSRKVSVLSNWDSRDWM